MNSKFTKWELTIEWFDDKKYQKLSPNEKDKLKEFRRINNYIKKLNQSITRDTLKIEKLKKGIRNRTTKIRGYKIDGTLIYDVLNDYIKKNEIDVYYTEGKHKKQLKGNWTRLKGEQKYYPQSNLKYKSKNTRNTKTINLKPTRKETLEILKRVCPKWYKVTGGNLLNKDYENVKIPFISLFKPLILELINKDYGNKKPIKFDDLIELMKKKKM